LFLSETFQNFVASTSCKIEIEDFEYEDILLTFTSSSFFCDNNFYANLYTYNYRVSSFLYFIETYSFLFKITNLLNDSINSKLTNTPLYSSFLGQNIDQFIVQSFDNTLYIVNEGYFSSYTAFYDFEEDPLEEDSLNDPRLFYRFFYLDLGDFENFWGFIEPEDIYEYYEEITSRIEVLRDDRFEFWDYELPSADLFCELIEKHSFATFWPLLIRNQEFYKGFVTRSYKRIFGCFTFIMPFLRLGLGTSSLNHFNTLTDPLLPSTFLDIQQILSIVISIFPCAV